MLDAMMKQVTEAFEKNTASNDNLAKSVDKLTLAMLDKNDNNTDLAALIVTALGDIAAGKSGVEVAESLKNTPRASAPSDSQNSANNAGGGAATSAAEALNSPIAPVAGDEKIVTGPDFVAFVTGESNKIEKEMQDRQTAVNMILALQACATAIDVKFMQELTPDRVAGLLPVLRNDLKALYDNADKSFTGICGLAGIEAFPKQ